MNKIFFYLSQFLCVGAVAVACAMDMNEIDLQQEIKRLGSMGAEAIEQYKPTGRNEQYCLGVYHIVLFENFGQSSNLDLAEFWFLKAKEFGCERSFCNLIQLYVRKKEFEKAIEIAQEGINKKYYACYLQLMKLYQVQNNPEKAIEAARCGIVKIKDIADYEHILHELKFELGLLLVRRKINKDINAGIELLTELIAQEHHKAHLGLAIVYAFGNQCTKIDLVRSKKILRTLLSFSTVAQETRSHAVALLGYLYEVHNEISEAVKVYKANLEYNGKGHMARLVLSGKIHGDYDAARHVLEENFSINETLTLFYALLLMAEGNADVALAISQRNVNKQLFHVVMTLQYAIAYKYGFGFAQSDADAAICCNMINALPDTQEAIVFCKGYIKLLGLGGEFDVKGGLALIDLSKKLKPDPYFPRQAFMPVIEKIREHYASSVLDELMGTTRTHKKSTPKKVKNGNASYKPNPFTTAAFWNSKEFPVYDTCKVISIDVESHTIIIGSPETNEIFEVIVDGFRDDARWVKKLIYHSRIKERQGIGAKIDEKTRHNHAFPEIIDYIIQIGGIEVPFMKNGIVHEQLVMPVKRINTETGESVYCRAEYTFGQDLSGTKYVYHRLLRPQNASDAGC